MTPLKNKILIVFPEYSSDSANHYPYWYELFDEVAKKLDLAILFERGKSKPEFDNVKFVEVQKWTVKPFNLIERFLKIIKYINRGYTRIYIHYSYWGVFLSNLISLFKPIKIYYWNCERYSQKPADKLIALALQWSDVLVTGSDSIGDSYRKVFGLDKKPIKVVCNWVRELKVEPKRLSKDKTHVLFVHHLASRKGSRELPVIIKETVKQKPNVYFHIVGLGPDKKYLRSQITSYKLQDCVTFYGDLPLKKVVELYKVVDYLIMPSRSEGFPRVILEAMIYKLPFVATNVGNVREIVGQRQKQFLVEPRKPKRFADNLIRLMGYSQTEELLKQNYNRAQRYNKERAVRLFISVLKT